MHESYINFLSVYYVSGTLLDAGADSLQKKISFPFEISETFQHNLMSATGSLLG